MISMIWSDSRDERCTTGQDDILPIVFLVDRNAPTVVLMMLLKCSLGEAVLYHTVSNLQ